MRRSSLGCAPAGLRPARDAGFSIPAHASVKLRFPACICENCLAVMNSTSQIGMLRIPHCGRPGALRALSAVEKSPRMRP